MHRNKGIRPNHHLHEGEALTKCWKGTGMVVPRSVSKLPTGPMDQIMY